MGAWGFNILENDSSADAYSEYVDCMNAGLSPKQAMTKVKKELAEVLEDKDDAAYVWLGVAKAMWEYGHIDDAMVKRIAALATSDAHLSEWDDAGPKGREKRRKVIEGFADKLRTENPKPKKPRTAKLRSPVYEPGTCLSIQHPSGQYLAVLVLFNRTENPGAGQDTFGINTLLLLDYLKPKPPTIDVFELRDAVREESDTKIKPWIPLVRDGFSNFHRRAKDKLSVVGRIPLTRRGILESRCITFWDFPDGPELIKKWRGVKRKPDLFIAERLDDLPEWRKHMAEMDRILREGNPKQPVRKTFDQQLDLSPLDD